MDSSFVKLQFSYYTKVRGGRANALRRDGGFPLLFKEGWRGSAGVVKAVGHILCPTYGYCEYRKPGGWWPARAGVG